MPKIPFVFLGKQCNDFFLKLALKNLELPFSSAEMQPWGQFRHGVMQAS